MKIFKKIIVLLVIAVVIFFLVRWGFSYYRENAVLKQIISRLEADSRVAEVLVTKVIYDEPTGKIRTTIKFLEYDTNGQPLKPKYFTFTGNIIQFQSLVIRFNDIDVRNGDQLKGKSAYLFWKVFMLDGANTQEYDITELEKIPEGYKLPKGEDTFERKLWGSFWKYALDNKESEKTGIKNAQIEAPGMLFSPGILYTIKIEHDGGLRIDASPLSPILAGEQIPPPKS